MMKIIYNIIEKRKRRQLRKRLKEQLEVATILQDFISEVDKFEQTKSKEEGI